MKLSCLYDGGILRVDLAFSMVEKQRALGDQKAKNQLVVP
jgi:hypothetical protein